MCSALGGVYLRVVWDTSVSDKPWVQPVPADVGVPDFAYDKLRSVTFWRIVADDGTDVLRHLEMHATDSNQIIHGLYQGGQTDLGQVVPMNTHPTTARIFATLKGDTLALPDLPDDAASVVYIPNIKPNKLWRDLGPELWPLGRSDYQGVEPMMDALDHAYSNWMRDVDLAAMRLIVPSSYLDNIGRGQGGVFEPDRRVFVPLEYLGAEGGPPQITANQFEIRWEAHQQTCVDLANRCVQEAGYSPQSFGDYAGPAVTATEIEARERTSLLTRSKKIRYWRPALQDIIYSLMCVSRKYFNATAIVPERPDVNFTAVAVPDATAMAQTVAALAGADAASKRTLVAMVHPEWAEEEINQEVAQILAETGIELAQHAKIALSAPMGETLTDEVTELAQPVNVQAPAPKDSDAEDEQQDSPEGD
jgi:Phage portal protein, SPP1 Gp6-like